ncbi:MAG TPA: DUF167 domain-containing protein [Chitinispirillaceae bacterium]|nr:DUF167 domain-containing protein [Chitinispirillaceae bacterium]
MKSCSFEIRLKPRAKKDQIHLSESGILEISVTSPPVDNKANQHLVKFLADRLDIPRKSMEIIRGEHSRNKVISVDGLSRDEIIQRLQQ